jgi:hypothetical protein
MMKVHHGEIPFTWRRGLRQDHVTPPPSRGWRPSPLPPDAVGAAGDDVAIQLELELPLGAGRPSPEEAGHA